MRSTIDLAGAFGLSVICEGIETGKQADPLRLLGCKRGQGCLFAPALPVDELEAISKLLA